MARKKSYPGGFRLTLATARRLAVQEFGTAKGLEPDRGTYLEGFFTMRMGSSVAQMVGNQQVAQGLTERAYETFETELDKAVYRILTGWR